MAKIQIKSENSQLLEDFFQSWRNLTPCNHLLSTQIGTERPLLDSIYAERNKILYRIKTRTAPTISTHYIQCSFSRLSI